MSVIRSAGLRGFRHVVAELGGDAEALARRARLDPAALDADDLLVDDVAVATALEEAATELACPDLGLRVARHQDLSLLGPLALAVENSPTVADALDCTARYLYVHAPAMRITTEPDPDDVRGVEALRYDLAPPGITPPRQAIDLCVASLHRNITTLAGGAYGLRTVDLPHEPLAPRATYEEFFGARVRFGRPHALLRLPTSLGLLPITGRDESVRRMALSHLAQQTPADDDRLEPRVRGAVQQLLGTRAPEIDVVAGLLDLHPRTLQRRLSAEGTGFAEILDAVRREAARRYLTTTDLPLGQVAGLLGFAEQAVLTRACRRWWGSPPREVRRAAQVPVQVTAPVTAPMRDDAFAGERPPAGGVIVPPAPPGRARRRGGGGTPR